MYSFTEEDYFMSTTSPDRSQITEQTVPSESGVARGVIAWSSFFFACLQSICTFFALSDGLRLAIGIGSLAMSAGVDAALDRFHADWIRVPMVLLALFGSSLNLVILL